MLTTHQHHHPSDKIMITRTKATTSKRDETRTRRQKPNDWTQKNHPFFLFLSLWRAIVRVFSSVLSSLLSDRIRFRIGRNRLFIHINQSPSSSFLGARKRALKREKQARMMKSSKIELDELERSLSAALQREFLIVPVGWCCRNESKKRIWFWGGKRRLHWFTKTCEKKVVFPQVFCRRENFQNGPIFFQGKHM